MKMDVKQSRGEATKAEIITVARQLFSEHGYHGTGIADIQEATGLTKGAFYHHFRTKEELALAVLNTAKQDYVRFLIEPAMKKDTPRQRLTALLDGAVALNSQPQWRNCQMLATLCADLTQADQRLHNAVQEMQLSLFETWREMIAEAQQAGEADDSVEPEVWAQLIINSMVGALISRKIGSTQIQVDKIIEFMKQKLLEFPT